MKIRVYVSGTLQQLQRLDENDKVKSARPATAEEVWMYDRLIAASMEADQLSQRVEELKAERDERLTLEESSRLARKVDDLEEDNAALSARLLELDAMRGAHTPERPGEFDPPTTEQVQTALDKIAAAGRKLAGPKGDRNG